MQQQQITAVYSTFFRNAVVIRRKTACIERLRRYLPVGSGILLKLPSIRSCLGHIL